MQYLITQMTMSSVSNNMIIFKRSDSTHETKQLPGSKCFPYYNACPRLNAGCWGLLCQIHDTKLLFTHALILSFAPDLYFLLSRLLAYWCWRYLRTLSPSVLSFSIMTYQFHHITDSQYERIIPHGHRGIASRRYRDQLGFFKDCYSRIVLPGSLRLGIIRKSDLARSDLSLCGI